MGYFSNGTEGELYEAQYCERCQHGRDAENGPMGCPVWGLHFDWNYAQCRDDKVGQTVKFVLGVFIPRSPLGGSNQRCAMFIPLEPKETEPSTVDAAVVDAPGQIHLPGMEA